MKMTIDLNYKILSNFTLPTLITLARNTDDPCSSLSPSPPLSSLLFFWGGGGGEEGQSGRGMFVSFQWLTHMPVILQMTYAYPIPHPLLPLAGVCSVCVFTFLKVVRQN